MTPSSGRRCRKRLLQSYDAAARHRVDDLHVEGYGASPLTGYTGKRAIEEPV
jgi:hypothetical protein